MLTELSLLARTFVSEGVTVALQLVYRYTVNAGGGWSWYQLAHLGMGLAAVLWHVTCRPRASHSPAGAPAPAQGMSAA